MEHEAQPPPSLPPLLSSGLDDDPLGGAEEPLLLGGDGGGGGGGVGGAPQEANLLTLLQESAPQVHTLTTADVSGGGGGGLTCPVVGCGATCRARSNLTLHLKSHPPSLVATVTLPAPPPKRAGRFHCCAPGCAYAPGNTGGKTLANLKSAQNHYAQLHAPKRFTCTHPRCVERPQFSQRNQLNRHVMNVHQALRCACGTTFASKAALVKHVKQFSVSHPGGGHAAVADEAATRALAEGGGGEGEMEEEEGGGAGGDEGLVADDGGLGDMVAAPLDALAALEQAMAQ
jgi:hypothetical protein